MTFINIYHIGLLHITDRTIVVYRNPLPPFHTDSYHYVTLHACLRNPNVVNKTTILLILSQTVKKNYLKINF